MTKQQSQIMKGVAILMMIFYHLFNRPHNVALCHNLVFVDGTPLVSILSQVTNPVAFFLILGGYGLYKVYEKGDKHRWSRLLKLYIHYWAILLIFLAIGHFIVPTKYPGSVVALLKNVTGFETTYNGEMWFLFPYVVLSALSPFIFRIMAKFRAITIIVITLFIHLCTSYSISRYGPSFWYHNYWAYNLLLVFHLLFSFTLGAIAARSRFFEQLKARTDSYGGVKSIIAWGGIAILVLISCVFRYNFFYAFGIITCLLLVRMPRWIQTILGKLGDQSMNMWMIHSWFCYYLFRDFIYSFSYPLLIFVVLTVISYVCSLIVNILVRPAERLVMTKSEINTKPIL